jgi:hypothetical protein
MAVRLQSERLFGFRRNLHANLECHHTGDQVNDVARRIVSALERRGVRALNPAMGFPMEMEAGRVAPGSFPPGAPTDPDVRD